MKPGYIVDFSPNHLNIHIILLSLMSSFHGLLILQLAERDKERFLPHRRCCESVKFPISAKWEELCSCTEDMNLGANRSYLVSAISEDTAKGTKIWVLKFVTSRKDWKSIWICNNMPSFLPCTLGWDFIQGAVINIL